MLALSVLLSPGYHSSVPSTILALAASKTLAKSPWAALHRLLLSRALWQLVPKHNIAFDSQQHGTSAPAPTSLPGVSYNMLLSLITINALAASALAPGRNRLPVQQRRVQSSSISMRYGRKQLKIRQRSSSAQIRYRFSRLTG